MSVPAAVIVRVSRSRFVVHYLLCDRNAPYYGGRSSKRCDWETAVRTAAEANAKAATT